MAVTKYLTRIKASASADEAGKTDTGIASLRSSKKSAAVKMHDNTYGITSDPLTQFGKQAREVLMSCPQFS